MPETFELVNDVVAEAVILRVSMPEGTVYDLRVDPNRYMLEVEMRMTSLEARQREIQNEIGETLNLESDARMILARRQDAVSAALLARAAALEADPNADDLPVIPEESEDEAAARVSLREVAGKSDRLFQELLEVVHDMVELAITPTNPDWTRDIIAERLDLNQARAVARFFVQQGVARRNASTYRWSRLALPTPTAPSPRKNGTKPGR